MAENFRVEGFVLGLAIKAPVRTFTTAPITLSGLQTINLYLTQVGDRVLVMNQANPVDNGIYTAQISAWRRDGDSDGNRDWVGGTIVPAYRPSDGEIVLFNVDGQPSAITVGISNLTFSVYFDPMASSGGEDLQATTVLGNTTDQGIGITTGATLGIFDAANVEAIGIGINSVILAPAPALEFAASANIEAYQFDEDVNVDGDVFIGPTGRLGGYRRNAAVSSNIQFSTGPSNITYTALGRNVFVGEMDIPSYRIGVFQFTIIANSVTVNANLTAACRIDAEAATANFNVVLTPPVGTGFYREITIEITQGSGGFDAIWPASVEWPGGTPPVLTATNNVRDVIHLWTRDAGITWTGSFLQDYS